MDVQAAFMQDICANPDDDTPRLVYADWLDENGDPERARFIRVQCQLALLGRFDLRRYELEVEEVGLLRLHGKEWRKPLAKFTADVEFRRGLPYRFAMSAAAFAEKGEELFALAPTLREYRVKRPAEGWDQMLASPALEQVTSLDVGQSGITVARTRALARSPRVRNLRQLNLTNAKLRGAIADLAASPHLAGLRKLSVGYCGLRDDGVGDLLRGQIAENLTALDLAENELGAEGCVRLARWGGASRLERLVLSERGPGDDAALALAAGDWSGLRDFALFLFRMGTSGLEALAHCHALSGLRQLNLICDNGVRYRSLFASEHLAGTESLFVGRELPAADLRELAAGPMLPHLRHLWFYAPEAEGVAAILSSPASAGLRELSLHGEVDDARRVAKALADARHLTNLRKLTLTQMPFGVEDTRVLAGAAHLANLVHLCIRAPGLDEAAIRPLLDRFGEGVVSRS